MKAKLMFIEVDESRLLYSKGENRFALYMQDNLFDVKGFKPIKPVLVGEGLVGKGDRFVLDGFILTCPFVSSLGYIQNEICRDDWLQVKDLNKLITQDTEELYEQIASGELVEGVWYEFEGTKGSKAFTDPNNPNIVAKIYEHINTPLKVVDTPQKTDEEYKEFIESIPYDRKPSHTEPNEVTNEVTKEDILKDLKDYFEGCDCYFQYVSIENCMKAMDKWAIERMNK